MTLFKHDCHLTFLKYPMQCAAGMKKLIITSVLVVSFGSFLTTGCSPDAPIDEEAANAPLEGADDDDEDEDEGEE